ncbi:MAG TPA: hypothetical protein VG758_29910 [Hyphomicrobiaceae bacterium]|nr:hypothetical protein [Hyphomicrobiaceae bacterium]
MLILALNAVPSARAQQQIRVELSQLLLDQWIAVAPAFFKMSKSNPDFSRPETEVALRVQMEKACIEAGFDSYDQCAEVFGYVGIIIAGCDRRTRSFRDPIPLMRRQLARLEADISMPPAERDKQISELRQLLAALPDRLPTEHLRLMTANRDRIFKAILSAGG